MEILTEADREGREAGDGGSAEGDASQGGADGANSEHGVVVGCCVIVIGKKASSRFFGYQGRLPGQRFSDVFEEKMIVR